MRCGKRVRLRGGYVAEVRHARKVHTCFYCRKPVQPGQRYVALVKYGSKPECYHVECFNRLMPHRVVVVLAGGESRLCYVLEDDSAL
jgi:hypothetical protein